MSNENLYSAGLFPAEIVEKFLMTPETSFPCNTCDKKEQGARRCKNYQKCGLWLDWAKKQIK